MFDIEAIQISMFACTVLPIFSVSLKVITEEYRFKINLALKNSGYWIQLI